MRLLKLLAILATTALLLAAAANPVAKVTGSDSFLLSGQPVSVEGVPAWPLLAGDDIAAGKTPVTIDFKNGSRVVLAAQSKARVESAPNGGLAFRLLDGSMRILAGSTAPGLRFYSRNNAVTPAPSADTTVGTPGSAAKPVLNSNPISTAARPRPVSSR